MIDDFTNVTNCSKEVSVLLFKNNQQFYIKFASVERCINYMLLLYISKSNIFGKQYMLAYSFLSQINIQRETNVFFNQWFLIFMSYFIHIIYCALRTHLL